MPQHCRSDYILAHERAVRPLPAGGVLAALLAAALGTLAVPLAHAQAPGPESFAKTPETPREFWDAADYLTRTGQAPKAVPYLQAFLNANPDDATLLEIRDRYGVGSVLRLQDDPSTRPFVDDALRRMNTAALRQARNPERIAKFVKALMGNPAEQRYAIEQLRQAGPYAVPAILEALQDPGLDAGRRALLGGNLGRLDRTAVPPLVATLDAPDRSLASAAAVALGQIADARAVPFLTFPAANPDDPVLHATARGAIERLTGRSWAGQLRSPLRVLIDEARNYATHRTDVPDPGELWSWEGNGPAPRVASRREAEGRLGVQLSRQALKLDPGNREAQTLQVALGLEQVIATRGLDSILGLDPGATPPDEAISQALQAGPAVLSDVLTLALQTPLHDLAAATATLLGRVADRNTLLPTDGVAHPLVAALGSPDRQVRLAAAQSLVTMSPQAVFPGSSQVVPVLSQFVAAAGVVPQVVVVDRNPNQANTVGSTLQALGYDPLTAMEGPEGFRLASSSAGVEAVLVHASGIGGPWSLADLLTNLRADARTAGLPVLVYGPLELQDRLFTQLDNNPRAAFVVTPVDAAAAAPILKRELQRLGAAPRTAEQTAESAQKAAILLAMIAQEPGTPFSADLEQAQDALVRGIAGGPGISGPSAVALGSVPGPVAQRRLADYALDVAAPPEVRVPATVSLARSIQRFGPLITDRQERALLAALDAAQDPSRRQALAAALGALKPRADLTGRRLEAVAPEVLVPGSAPRNTGAPAAGPALSAPPTPPNPQP